MLEFLELKKEVAQYGINSENIKIEGGEISK